LVNKWRRCYSFFWEGGRHQLFFRGGIEARGKRSWVKSSNGASVQTRVCRRKERLLKTCREVRRFLAQNQVRAYLSSIRQSSQRRKEKVVEVLSEATFPARSTAIIPI
jgi:hypothetical protein